MMQTASIFLNIEKRMIGPLGFLGFCNGTSIPWFISFEQSLSDAIQLKISAILSSTQWSVHYQFNWYFITSRRFILISTYLNGLDITVGQRSSIGLASFQNMSLKYLAMIFVCATPFFVILRRILLLRAALISFCQCF